VSLLPKKLFGFAMRHVSKSKYRLTGVKGLAECSIRVNFLL